jgi:hypothetical protein
MQFVFYFAGLSPDRQTAPSLDWEEVIVWDAAMGNSIRRHNFDRPRGWHRHELRPSPFLTAHNSRCPWDQP